MWRKRKNKVLPATFQGTHNSGGDLTSNWAGLSFNPAEQRRASMLGHGALPSPLPRLLWLTPRCCQGYHLLILAHNFQPQQLGSLHEPRLTLAPRGLRRTEKKRGAAAGTATRLFCSLDVLLWMSSSILDAGASEVFTVTGGTRRGRADVWGTTVPLWSCSVLQVIVIIILLLLFHRNVFFNGLTLLSE